jgi:muramoyltetrapeptide carboxypeptidase
MPYCLKPISLVPSENGRKFIKMQQRIKPRRLLPGDLIGIISPSSPVASICPRRLERGIKQLESIGFETQLGKHALKRNRYMAGTIQERIADLHAMITDPKIKAVFMTIGGTCANNCWTILIMT